MTLLGMHRARQLSIHIKIVAPLRQAVIILIHSTLKKRCFKGCPLGIAIDFKIFTGISE